jgi:phospholipase C
VSTLGKIRFRDLFDRDQPIKMCLRLFLEGGVRVTLGGSNRSLHWQILGFVTAALLVVGTACTPDVPELPRARSRRQEASTPSTSHAAGVPPKLAAARRKIKHIVIVMQENRSFDHYFGTFPGADGIPMEGAEPICVPNPQAPGGCTRLFHDPTDENQGGPHDLHDALAVINGGKMDGFIRRWLQRRPPYCDENPSTLVCHERSRQPGVVGYHDAREIPNYWRYAEEFVLQDRMFASNLGWSQPSHLYMVSGWSAECAPPTSVDSCVTDLDWADNDAVAETPSYPWTDITYLLRKHDVSWRYYVAPNTTPECDSNDGVLVPCAPQPLFVSNAEGTPEIWNPLPDFATVHEGNQLRNIQGHHHFFRAAAKGKLASVSWVMPSYDNSEHPFALVSKGQAWVTRVVNAIMRGPDWKSSAIFISWDDWGGFYDHVRPVRVDRYGYGLRVPGLVVSPYAKGGFIDHQTLSFDAYLKLIEDIFLESERLDPKTLDRPDSRPTVRETVPQLGNLLRSFDFSRAPRPPLILRPYP